MADKNFDEFWESTGGKPGAYRNYCYQGWRAAIEFMEAQNTSTNSAMDAIRKAYIEGYSMGHHHTVESCYCPEQAADDWLSEQHQ